MGASDRQFSSRTGISLSYDTIDSRATAEWRANIDTRSTSTARYGQRRLTIDDRRVPSTMTTTSTSTSGWNRRLADDHGSAGRRHHHLHAVRGERLRHHAGGCRELHRERRRGADSVNGGTFATALTIERRRRRRHAHRRERQRHDQPGTDNGNDTVNGGAGTDTLLYTGIDRGPHGEPGDDRRRRDTGAAGSDTISNFENLTGGSGGDTLTGRRGRTRSTAAPATTRSTVATATTS